MASGTTVRHAPPASPVPNSLVEIGMAFSSIQQRELDEAGFLVLTDFMSSALLDRLRERVDQLLTLEAAQAGS